MDSHAYSAFVESCQIAGEPVSFRFSEAEVEAYNIPGEPEPFTGEITHDLEERGYPYLRAALIFEEMNERLK